MIRARECAYEHVQVLLEQLTSLGHDGSIDVPDAFDELERIWPGQDGLSRRHLRHVPHMTNILTSGHALSLESATSDPGGRRDMRSAGASPPKHPRSEPSSFNGSPRRRLCVALVAASVALPAAITAPVASASGLDVAAASGSSLVLPSGDELHLFAGATSGEQPMGAISWSAGQDLGVNTASSGNQAISIGQGTSTGGSYSSLAAAQAIAGVGLRGYTIEQKVTAQASKARKLPKKNLETATKGLSLHLKFSTTEPEQLALILMGGQDVSNPVLSGFEAQTLENQTYTANSSLEAASIAVYTAKLLVGKHAATWKTTTFKGAPSNSLGAVAYILKPGPEVEREEREAREKREREEREAREREVITSYNKEAPGAPHHGYFDVAWQNFTAKSNTITLIGATVGTTSLPAGQPTGIALTMRLCSSQPEASGACPGQLVQTSGDIVNYGTTEAAVDVPVSVGTTYWLEWLQPSPYTWVTYWWAGGSTIEASEEMQAIVQGHDYGL
jgi:hypothetical protein